MAKVKIGPEYQSEMTKFEKLPPNVVAEVADAKYAKIKKDSFTNKNGELVPESEKFYAVLTFVLPESTEPTKTYIHDLSVGEVLVGSPDGTYLDDVMATTDKQKLLNPNTGWATFTRSLRTAGAENGLYTTKEDELVTDNITTLVGTKFTVGYAEKQGGPTIGAYAALIALVVHQFGKQDVNADMDAVVAEVKKVLAPISPAVGLSVAELVGKLGSLTGAQFELAKQSFANNDWLKQVEATGQLFKRTAAGRFIKV